MYVLLIKGKVGAYVALIVQRSTLLIVGVHVALIHFFLTFNINLHLIITKPLHYKISLPPLSISIISCHQIYCDVKWVCMQDIRV